MEVKEIEKYIREKQDAITILRKEINDLEKWKLEVKTGLKEGDLVVDDKGQKGILVYKYSWSWNWRKLKKDGSPSWSVTSVSRSITKVED